LCLARQAKPCYFTPDMSTKVNPIRKAVILAGGKGTRLYPITKEIPKPLLPVNRKPIISYLVDLFLAHGIDDIAVIVNQDFREDFEWWKKRYFPETKLTIVQEEQPLGTFGGLYLLRDWIGRENFFLTNGDELKDIDLQEMAQFHTTLAANNDLRGTLALLEVPNPKEYGVVLCDAHSVKEFLEKPENPPSNYINSGLYLLSSKIVDEHPGPQFLMIEKDVFPALAKEGKLAAFKFRGRWMDCGTWERYERALREWKTT
jgi:mannose-1-phosphate guanylyltransferase